MMCAYIADVTEVKVLESYRLYLKFDDGREGELDISELVPFTGVFEAMKDIEFFRQVNVNSEIGTICWRNGADLAPEYLYQRLTKTI